MAALNYRLHGKWRIMNTMKPVPPSPLLDRLVEPLSKCLTPESAKRLLALKADKQLQATVDRLADKCTQGALTVEEEAEYASYVSFGTFVALLKSKARQMLDSPDHR